MQLNTDDLIELAETGKVTRKCFDEDSKEHSIVLFELDDMAKIVLHECLYMLKFEKRFYTKGKKKNER